MNRGGEVASRLPHKQEYTGLSPVPGTKLKQMPYKDPKKQAEFQRIWKRKRTERLRDIKNGPCTDCGKIFHPACMQWDHIEGRGKFKELSGMSQYRFERCLEEISKCELVCGNCHALRTYYRSLKQRQDRR